MLLHSVLRARLVGILAINLQGFIFSNKALKRDIGAWTENYGVQKPSLKALLLG
jgi:hypothetical protein